MDLQSKGLWVIVIMVLLSGLVLFSDFLENKKEMKIPLGKEQSIEEQMLNDKDAQVNEEEIQVYIVGEIKKPGIYSLQQGKRVSDLVEMAGGLTESAVLLNNNLAKILRDEEKVIILGEASDTLKYPELASKLNLNRATKEELMMLNGVGAVLAMRILDDRLKNGLFTEVRDILRVKGIGEATLKKFVNDVCVY